MEPLACRAAIVLTGGASRRMGRDKTRLVIDDTTLAARTAALVRRVVPFCVEVGPGVTDLLATREATPGEGPLVAVAAGWRYLCRHSYFSSALVLAADLPLLSESLLRHLVEAPGEGTVLPIVDGHPQPLLARWSQADLAEAARLVDSGVRSLRHLEGAPGVSLLEEEAWSKVADATTFADVDSPEDLVRLKIAPVFADDEGRLNR